MIFNASILAQLRSKRVFNLFFINLIVSTLVLVINSI